MVARQLQRGPSLLPYPHSPPRPRGCGRMSRCFRAPWACHGVVADRRCYNLPLLDAGLRDSDCQTARRRSISTKVRWREGPHFHCEMHAPHSVRTGSLLAIRSSSDAGILHRRYHEARCKFLFFFPGKGLLARSSTSVDWCNDTWRREISIESSFRNPWEILSCLAAPSEKRPIANP